MSAPSQEWTVAPCGCGFGVVGDAFVIEPCDMLCPTYLYVVAESERQGKPRSMIDMR